MAPALVPLIVAIVPASAAIILLITDGGAHTGRN